MPFSRSSPIELVLTYDTHSFFKSLLAFGKTTDTTDIIRGSQWGGVFYGYRLKFWLFLFQLRLTKKLKINFFCFKELNINKPVFLVSLSKIKVLGSSRDEISYSFETF